MGSGGASLAATLLLSTVDGKTEEVPASVHDEGDGSYAVSFTVLKAAHFAVGSRL